MNNQPNNILSYFIKDIKDAKELAFYRQINHNNGNIQILYKDEILYEIQGNYFYNRINNVVKWSALKYIWHYKIYYNVPYNCKLLYYKKDRQIKVVNLNYIRYHFTYNKYLKKLNFKYVINNIPLLYISIIYSKKYKYIRNRNGTRFRCEFTSAMILIPNKYELQYYCNFFNLYFSNN
jgi:hypothetical protein